MRRLYSSQSVSRPVLLTHPTPSRTGGAQVGRELDALDYGCLAFMRGAIDLPPLLRMRPPARGKARDSAGKTPRWLLWEGEVNEHTVKQSPVPMAPPWCQQSGFYRDSKGRWASTDERCWLPLAIRGEQGQRRGGI